MNDPAVRIGVSSIDDESYKITCNIWVSAHGFEDTRLMINEKVLIGLNNMRKAEGDNAKSSSQ